ncbi:MAG: hypothetical protein ACM30G_07880 [Micromonosporaceae bacterium]
MSVNFPLSLGARPASRAGGSTVALPVNLGGPGLLAPNVTARESRALPAVAAAAPIAQPQRALEVATQARENPGVTLSQLVEADLKPVLDAVIHAQSDRSGAPTPTEVERVVAREIGADPVLVAVASSVVRANTQAADAVLYWVASADLDLYERATRAAVRETLLAKIPVLTTQAPSGGQPGPGDSGARMMALETAVDGLEATVKSVDSTVKNLNAQITDLTTRVERLEGGGPSSAKTKKQ